MTAADCKHHNCYALESCPCACHASQRRPAAVLNWPRIIARAEAEAWRQAHSRDRDSARCRDPKPA